MNKDDLLNNLSKLGLPMFIPTEEVDVNATLAEIVKTHDPRLWEMFPAALANAAEHYKFTPYEIEHLLPKSEINNFHNLYILSNSLYSYYHLRFSWLDKFKDEYLSHEDRSRIKQWKVFISHDQTIGWDDTKIEPLRLKHTFKLYFEQIQDKAIREKGRHDEFSLAYSLSQIFSPKQAELFKKKLDGLPLSKTEQEYYSRSVKKKVLALANSELHSLARKLLEQ